MTEKFGQQLDSEQIMKLIIHRYPMLLVDKVVAWERNQSMHAIKQVTINEPYFPGHFPAVPIMPGVLLIEAMSQACALLLTLSTGNGCPSKAYLAGIDNARFRRHIKPGDTLDLHVQMQRRRSGFFRFGASTLVDGKLASQADLLCYGES